MPQPRPVAEYGEMENLDVSINDIRSRLGELMPYLRSREQSGQELAGEAPLEPTPLAEARLKSVQTQLAQFPGQARLEEEIV